MKFSIQTITPKKAAELLGNNPNNRAIRENHVNSLANEMLSGRWIVTAQGVSLASDNEVVDGQHRLTAVIRAGIPVQMMVATDVPKEAIDVYDIGAKRSVADTLHIRDGLPNCNIVTAAARQIASISCNFSNVTIPVALARVILAEYGEELQDAFRMVGHLKQAKKAWVIAAVAFAMRHDKSIRRFAESLGNGEGLSRGNPSMTARQWLINGTAEALVSGWKAGAYECLFNIMLAHSKGQEAVRPTRGVAGIMHYRMKSKIFIESIRPEMARLRGSKAGKEAA